MTEGEPVIDISDFIPTYATFDNPRYNLDYYTKKEFYERRLQPLEEVTPGTFLANQIIIANFMAASTLNDGMLLMHQAGTGKTRASIAVIEKIRNESTKFKRAIICTRGETLQNNYIYELVEKATSGRYLPPGIEMVKDKKERQRKIMKLVTTFYTFKTFEKFAKELQSMPESTIKEQYSNAIIVIDEVHNLRLKPTEKQNEGINIYKQFHRLCHGINNAKIILMSATPMKDSADEIASVINLILPLSSQLPEGANFHKVMFDSKNMLKQNSIAKFKEIIRGRTSYLKSMPSTVIKEFVGTTLGKLKHMIVYPVEMSKFQSEYYSSAYISDMTGESGVYLNSRQASLFVFPDGSYGKSGFKDESNVRALLNKFIGGPDTSIESKLENLKKYSAIYSSVIETALKAARKGESAFIYCEYVSGGGLNLLSLLLDLMGYKRAFGNETSQGLRYALLTGDKDIKASKISKIIERFNQPDNMNGRYIQLVLGSRIVSEGVTLRNVQHEMILTPHWNYAETEQAIARGIRFKSHEDLERAGIVPEVKIYQYVSMPMQSDDIIAAESIDLKIYETAESKDFEIKSIERLIKETSFDCALTYQRNLNKNDKDFSRDCDYQKCNYKCDNIPSQLYVDAVSGLLESQIDYSSYNILYKNEYMKELKQRIISIFNIYFAVDIYKLTKLCIPFNQYQVLEALHDIIENNEKIYNAYGISCVLREESNVFYLIDSFLHKNTLWTGYYTNVPVTQRNVTFSEAIEPLRKQIIYETVNTLRYETESEDEVNLLMNKLNIEERNNLLEEIIIDHDNKRENVLQQKLLMSYFNKYLLRVNEQKLISSFLYVNKVGPLRCFNSNTQWTDCDDQSKETYKKEVEQALYENPYGFIGIYNRQTKKFSIRNLRDERGKGRECKTLNKNEIMSLICNIIKLDYKPSNKNRQQIIQELKLQQATARGGDTLIYDETQLNDPSLVTDEDLDRYVYWNAKDKKKEDICKAIQKWFEDNNLLIEIIKK